MKKMTKLLLAVFSLGLFTISEVSAYHSYYYGNRYGYYGCADCGSCRRGSCPGNYWYY